MAQNHEIDDVDRLNTFDHVFGKHERIPDRIKSWVVEELLGTSDGIKRVLSLFGVELELAGRWSDAARAARSFTDGLVAARRAAKAR